MAYKGFLRKRISSNASRGLISGFVGGLAGTAVKNLVEKFLPVRKVEQRSAQIKIVDELSTQLTGTPISLQNAALAEHLVDFPFGVSLGTAYGYGKRNKDKFRLADGMIFGVTTWVSTHETSLPILGLEAKPTNIPVKQQANELFAHLLFGITTELVRSFVSKKIGKA
ncbi:MAG: DUF1440 domain-containing protein [Gillisia sp.]